MSARRASFKQADAARALRAAMAAGLRPRGYTIATDGSITVDLDDVRLTLGDNTFDKLIGSAK